MKLPVILSPIARLEFNEAIDWYDQQDPGRGDHFDLAVHETIRRIQEQPLLHPILLEDVRAKRVTDYPYRVLYVVQPTIVTVLAVFHDSRDPSDWQSRRR